MATWAPLKRIKISIKIWLKFSTKNGTIPDSLGGGVVRMPTRIITVSELKARMSNLLAEVEEKGIPLYVTQYGKPKAVITSYDEYETLLKKIEDLEDMLAMKESLEAPEGEAISLEEYERKRETRISN